MIKKELETIRETERQCKELLAQAEREKQRALREAREEALLRHEALTRAAREEGERHAEAEAAREAADRAGRLARWEEEIARMRERSLSRVEDAVRTIFEGM